jgi:hypothetical protein
VQQILVNPVLNAGCTEDIASIRVLENGDGET